MFLISPQNAHMKNIKKNANKVISQAIPGMLQFSKFHLENPRSRSWVRSKVKVTQCKHHAVNSHPFHLKSNRQSIIFIPEIQLFKNLTLNIQKIKVKVRGEVKVQDHRVGPISYQLTCLLFHVPHIPKIWLF